MYLATTVDADYLMDQGQLEINPTTYYGSYNDFLSKAVGKDDEGFYFISLPNNNELPLIELKSFIEISYAEAIPLISNTIDPDATQLEKIRLYFYVEYTDSVYVLDLIYKDIKDHHIYRLDTVVVYNGCGSKESYKSTFLVYKLLVDDIKGYGHTRSLKYDVIKSEFIKETVLTAL